MKVETRRKSNLLLIQIGLLGLEIKEPMSKTYLSTRTKEQLHDLKLLLCKLVGEITQLMHDGDYHAQKDKDTTRNKRYYHRQQEGTRLARNKARAKPK
jgi:hypothetical protein